MNRRQFITTTAASAFAPTAFGKKEEAPLFEISLAQWSLHRMLKAGKLTNLDWPKYTQESFDIHALEYVNQFFKDKAEDGAYLAELNKRVSDLGMTNVLIMIDGEGVMGADTEKERNRAVDRHKKWVTAAQTLGCHSIRVNAYAKGTPEEAAKKVTDGLHKLSLFAAEHEINVLVENHGGHSSNGKWVSQVLSAVNLPNCGSLPDFGNFKEYDRYQGVRDLMPFAKGVSAKSVEFDNSGNEVHTDFFKIMKIVLEANYHGYVGIESTGAKHSEDEGVKLNKALLERVREKLK